MSVGVMKDYKLKQRNLRASHNFGLNRGKREKDFFSLFSQLQVVKRGV